MLTHPRLVPFTLGALLFALLAGLSPEAAAQAKGKDTVAKVDGTQETGTVLDEQFGGISFEAKKGSPATLPWSDVLSIQYGDGSALQQAVESADNGDLETAEATLQDIVGDTKVRPVVRQQALFNLALVQQGSDQVQPAMATWRNLLTEFPKGRYLRAATDNLVNLHLLGNDLGAAKNELDKIELSTKEVSAFKPVLAVIRGQLLEAQGKVAEARTAYASIESSAAASAELKYEAQLGLARCLVADKKASEAEPVFKQLVAEKGAPKLVLAAAWNGIGDLTLERGRSAKDIDTLLDAVFAYLRSSVQYLPSAAESSREYERGLAGAATCFKFISELEQSPERKKRYAEHSSNRIALLRKEFPNSEFLNGL